MVGRGAGRAGGDGGEDAVDIIGAAPLLVREHVARERALLALHELDVREHPVRLEARRELRARRRVQVQTRERDEL